MHSLRMLGSELEDDGVDLLEKQADAHRDKFHDADNKDNDAKSKTEECESETRQPERQYRKGSSSSNNDEQSVEQTQSVARGEST